MQNAYKYCCIFLWNSKHGLVWNDKLSFWGEKIGYPERFLTKENINSNEVLKRLFTAIDEGTREVSSKEKNSSKKELKHFVTHYCKRKSEKFEDIDFKSRLYAAALGGNDYKYKNLNSSSIFKESLKNGFKNFEVDVRQTSNKKLVCVNGWNAVSYAELGIDGEEYGLSGIPLEDFENAKYFNHFNTMSFRQLIKAVKKIEDKENLNIMLDTGKPKVPQLKIILKEINFYMNKNPDLKKYFSVKLHNEKAISVAKEMGVDIKYVYRILSKEEYEKKDFDINDTINLCKESNINLVAIHFDAFNEDVRKILNENNIKSFLYNPTKAGDIINAMNSGADFIATHFLSADYLQNLTD